MGNAAYEVLFRLIRHLFKRDTDLDVKKQFMDTLPHMLRDQVTLSFFTDKTLGVAIIENYLHTLLTADTKHFSFTQSESSRKAHEAILRMIPKLSPKIETINFSRFIIRTEFKEEFKTLLRVCTNLKSLRLSSYGYGPTHKFNCSISQLLFSEEFDSLDPEILNGLKKIEHINLFHRIGPAECAKILKLLPNLQGFGIYQRLSMGLSHYIETCEPPNRTLNITQFADRDTTIETLEEFAKYCPKTISIALENPQDGVIEKLWLFPCLKHIILIRININELINYLKTCAKNIRIHLFVEYSLKNLEMLQKSCRQMEEICMHVPLLNGLYIAGWLIRP